MALVVFPGDTGTMVTKWYARFDGLTRRVVCEVAELRPGMRVEAIGYGRIPDSVEVVPLGSLEGSPRADADTGSNSSTAQSEEAPKDRPANEGRWVSDRFGTLR